MKMFGLLVVLSLSWYLGSDAQVVLNSPYRQAYIGYYFYNRYNIPYTISNFCVYNLYNCDVSTYTNFCVSYETTCSYQIVTINNYYYLLFNRYCPQWCNRCRGTYTSTCQTTTTTTTTTTTPTPTRTVPTRTPSPAITTPVTTRTKCEYTKSRSLSQRVSGGGPAYQCDNPWTVAISSSHIPLLCQGVLIDHKTVVTTTECLDGILGPITVNVGEYVLNNKEPEDEAIPATLSNIDFKSGVVTLSLSKPVQYTRCIAPACLKSSDSTIAINPKKCRITGWGNANQTTFGYVPVLRTGDVVIPDVTECQSIFLLLNATTTNGVSFPDLKLMGCTSASESSSAACSFDMGGAVTCEESTTGEQILVGLIKTGLINTVDICATLKLTFFTNITTIL